MKTVSDERLDEMIEGIRLFETNKFTVSRISKSSTSKWKYNYIFCLYHPFNTKYRKVYVACKAVIWRHREKELVLEDCVISRME